MMDKSLKSLKAQSEALRERERPSANEVLIIHSNDQSTVDLVSGFLMQLGLKPVIVAKRASQGLTIAEKLQATRVRRLHHRPADGGGCRCVSRCQEAGCSHQTERHLRVGILHRPLWTRTYLCSDQRTRGHIANRYRY